METTKTLKLTKGDDSFIVSGQLTGQESVSSLSVTCENVPLNKKTTHKVNTYKNKEIIEIFLKLCNNLYWDFEQQEIDRLKLTELFSLFSGNTKPEDFDSMSAELIWNTFSIKQIS